MPAPVVHRFYTTESLSTTSKRAWTPEGFLLCQDVPIARVGTLLYGRGEIPVQPNADGLIRITRDPDEVFHPNAILSFAGKPVTDEHPPARVNPDNWKMYTIGTVLNPHQGDGGTENNELLYADLLIQDRKAIKDVMTGKREVSAGYDAEYEQIQPGEGKQHNIIGNHVALVARGRCGPICSIGDSAMAKVNLNPVQRKFKLTRDRIMEAFMTGDEETLVDELDKIPDMMGNVSTGGPVDVGGKGGGTSDDLGGGMHIHVHSGGGMDDAPKPPTAAAPMQPEASGPPGGAGAPAAGGGITLEQLAARIDQLEQAIAILAQGEGGGAPAGGGGAPEPGPDENSPGMSSQPPEKKEHPPTGDRLTGDSASMALSFQEVLSRAELLVPGMRRPTFDAAQPPKVTAQSMCDYRRMTLDTALGRTDEARDAVMAVAGQPKNPQQYIKTLSCDAITMVFNGSSEIIRTAGLRGGGGKAPAQTGLHHGGGTSSVMSVTDTVANINKLNRERYGVSGR